MSLTSRNTSVEIKNVQENVKNVTKHFFKITRNFFYSNPANKSKTKNRRIRDFLRRSKTGKPTLEVAPTTLVTFSACNLAKYVYYSQN